MAREPQTRQQLLGLIEAVMRRDCPQCEETADFKIVPAGPSTATNGANWKLDWNGSFCSKECQELIEVGARNLQGAFSLKSVRKRPE